LSSVESAAAWSEVAQGWERRDPWVSRGMRPVTERLLARLDPQPGQRILEIGAGLGEVGLLAAERVGPDGHVLLTDQSTGMVDAARRRSREASNVSVSVADAQALDVPSESVDGIVSRFAYMLVPDLAVGFAESRRVLRPGGRLVFSVWASPPENPWGSTIGRTLVELGHVEPPEPDAPGPFRLADAERARRLVAAAGFTDVEIEDVALTMTYASFDEYWDVTRDLAMSLRNALARLSEAETDDLRSRIERALEGYVTGDGLALPGRARVVTAT
jgi:SAM-dependent methyltransferase